jgi:hypothetical protein
LALVVSETLPPNCCHFTACAPSSFAPPPTISCVPPYPLSTTALSFFSSSSRSPSTVPPGHWSKL